MVDIKKLKAIMVLNDAGAEDLAKMLGVSKKTVSNRFTTGIFTSDEIEKITDFLKIENPLEVFFPDYAPKDDLNRTG